MLENCHLLTGLLANDHRPPALARLLLGHRPMHAIFFALKRSHYAALRLSRGPLSSLRLTPARFDLMFALDLGSFRERLYRPFGLWQSQLRRILGVAASTLSRMLRSLEELGLIERAKVKHDTRQRFVRLTAEGYLRMRRARRWFLDSGAVELAVDNALGKPWFGEASCLLETDTLESALLRLRAAYLDGASLHYPWHPDD